MNGHKREGSGRLEWESVSPGSSSASIRLYASSFVFLKGQWSWVFLFLRLIEAYRAAYRATNARRSNKAGNGRKYDRKWAAFGGLPERKAGKTRANYFVGKR